MSADDTNGIGKVNTRRIKKAANHHSVGIKADRLRQARIKAGFRSAQAAVDRFGWSAPAYRHHENGTREFGPDAAKVYAKAFKVNAAWLLALDEVRPIDAPLGPIEQDLEVVGVVQAGVWRTQAEMPEDERYTIKVGRPPFVGAERFAVRVEGRSMDRTIPPGSELECLRVKFGSVEPQPGDIVVVERHAHDLVELTCKRLAVDDGEWVLRAESTLSEFAEEIRLGKPSEDLFVDNEVQITGIVLRAYQSHFRRG